MFTSTLKRIEVSIDEYLNTLDSKGASHEEMGLAIDYVRYLLDVTPRLPGLNRYLFVDPIEVVTMNSKYFGDPEDGPVTVIVTVPEAVNKYWKNSEFTKFSEDLSNIFKAQIKKGK